MGIDWRPIMMEDAMFKSSVCPHETGLTETTSLGLFSFVKDFIESLLEEPNRWWQTQVVGWL